MDGEQWDLCQMAGGPLIFQGNKDARHVSGQAFPEGSMARYVRVWPSSWETTIGLRLELFAKAIGEPVGLELGFLPDCQISASSQREPATSPASARLNSTRGWLPAESAVQGAAITFDLGYAQAVTAILTQGAAHMEAWITRYRLAVGLCRGRQTGMEWTTSECVCRRLVPGALSHWS